MKQIRLSNGMIRLEAEPGNFIRRIGTSDASTGEAGRLCVLEDQVKYYEEVSSEIVLAAKEEQRRVTEYESKVAELIRQRYSADEEFAIQRKYLGAIKGLPSMSNEEQVKAREEFMEYNLYVEQCKTQAKL